MSNPHTSFLGSFNYLGGKQKYKLNVYIYENELAAFELNLFMAELISLETETVVPWTRKDIQAIPDENLLSCEYELTVKAAQN